MQIIDGRQIYLLRKAEPAVKGDGLLDEVHVHLQHGGQLTDGGVLVDGHEDLVEQRLEVVAHDAVHDKALKRGHAHAVHSSYGHVNVHQPLSAEYKKIYKDCSLL